MSQAVDPDYTVDWYRIPLPKETLAELNERSDLKGWVQAGGHLALMGVTASLSMWAFQTQAWALLIVALLLHGTVCSFCINAVHELVHGTVFKTKGLNNFFAGVFAFIGWINHRGFWASHAEHHRYTLHTPHDQEVIVPIDIRFKGLWRTIINPRAVRGNIKHHWRRARGDLLGEWDRKLFEGDPRHESVMAWSRFLLIGHLVATLVALSQGLWLLPVLISMTPAYGGTLQFFLNNTQHVGLQAHVNDFRLNSRSFHTNPIHRFLYWNMNYHIEHHMYAAVPCYNLKKLNKAISHEMPYVWNGLLETWWNIITCLYRQKHEPGYVFVPALPGDPEKTSAPVASARAPAKASLPPVGTPAEVAPLDQTTFRIWECSVCGFIYDERAGLPDQDITPGTRWDDLPEDWTCPDCGVGKQDFALATPVVSVG